MNIEDSNFIQSLSQTSVFTFDEVLWLFKELKESRELTEKIFKIWARSPHIHPSQYLHLLDFNKQ